ncbi:hypothetical protein CAOG_08649 [Capsaspora owczarzaki ATCC 30864]|uniref:AAA+ ATPase domain-containing protein n=1 Tax=Capsaspora owczarzaki (strain ATCC 30864) TaxID=595528 RepID=A0A0D2X242_CAPO3|nr:hypothetical protein CAOG_08649 [Capsaspora owczarzaki ATCC 30864]KJE91904.1 hypothetical protein CAOG_008649 [Capsaspora owczarzaki ATCC 30864]|eukprot:XP_011270260.1 hypothetical protein CAOG_08649 [Capsaspora owczarzaki ATCC 30864]
MSAPAPAAAPAAAPDQQQPAFRRVFGFIGGAVANTVATFIILVVAAFVARHVLDNKNTIAKTHSPEVVQARMLARFEAGSVIPPVRKSHIDRPDVVAMLEGVLRPKEMTRYPVVVGETGCGKTSAVLDAIRPNRTGIVYHIVKSEVLVSVPGLLAGSLAFEPNQFKFADAYLVDRGATLKDKPAEEPFKSWEALVADLEIVAAQFKAKHGHPATLVIDAVDMIAKKGPELLHVIQDFAKSAADANLLNVVLVTSDGSTLPALKESSAMTRARVVEVGDLTDQQAVTYLVRRDIHEDLAKRAVAEIAGGRLILLNNLADDLLFKTVDEIFREFYLETRGALLRLIGVLDAFDISPPVSSTFCLLSRGARDFDAVERSLGLDLTKKLLATNINILAYHPNKTYTLHSRHVQRSVAALLNCTRP